MKRTKRVDDFFTFRFASLRKQQLTPLQKDRSIWVRCVVPGSFLSSTLTVSSKNGWVRWQNSLTYIVDFIVMQMSRVNVKRAVGWVYSVAAPGLLRSVLLWIKTPLDVLPENSAWERRSTGTSEARKSWCPNTVHYRSQLYTSRSWAAGRTACENGRHGPNKSEPNSSFRVRSTSQYLLIHKPNKYNDKHKSHRTTMKYTLCNGRYYKWLEESVSEGKTWWGEGLDLWENFESSRVLLVGLLFCQLEIWILL